ncbi:hypothetical protein ES706_05255 [subsurface metagenome]
MLKEYEIIVGAGKTEAQGSSPRVAINRALQEQYANPSKFKGADSRLDYQLQVGETLVIKCSRVK